MEHVYFAHKIKLSEMNLADWLRELRLMKGQHGYRYVLAWIAVLVHVGARPTLIGLGIWVMATPSNDKSEAMHRLLPLIATMISKYFQLG